MSNFVQTDDSVRWFCALDEGRTAYVIGEEATPPALPENDRGLSRQPKPVGVNRGLISHSPYTILGGVLVDTLDRVSRQGFRVNQTMVQWVLKRVQTEDQGRMIATLGAHQGCIVYSDAFYDWRGRVYTISGEAGSLQTSKASRACMDAPEAVTINVTGKAWKYALKCFEHEGWATTPAEAKAFVAEAEGQQWADIDFMGVRAALAILEVDATGKTAYLLEQDATCSGFQHMAFASGDRDLAEITNATITAHRGDLYMEVARVGGIAESLSITDKAARKVAKTVVMLTGYGAGAPMIGLSYFNDRVDCAPFDSLEEAQESGLTVEFHGLGEVDVDTIIAWVKPLAKALVDRFPCIRLLKQACAAYFAECEEAGDEFRWTTPDGFEAIRLRMPFEEGTDRECTVHGALPNIIHSLDAEAVRRTIGAWTGVLGIVHDAFFTTIDRSLDLRRCVQDAYAATHRQYPDGFPITRKSRCMPVGMCIGV